MLFTALPSVAEGHGGSGEDEKGESEKEVGGEEKGWN